MIIKEVKNIEYKQRMNIKGSTNINHRIRVQLRLSMEEYVMMDFIFNWNQNHKTQARLMDYYYATGYVAENIQILFARMKTRKLLKLNSETKMPDVCDEWYTVFSTNDQQLNALWKIHPKGNKPTVRERLPKVLKKIPYEELESKLKAYLKYCNESNTFSKGLDTWMNPSKEHWNNPNGTPKVNQQSTVKIKFK